MTGCDGAGAVVDGVVALAFLSNSGWSLWIVRLMLPSRGSPSTLMLAAGGTGIVFATRFAISLTNRGWCHFNIISLGGGTGDARALASSRMLMLLLLRFRLVLVVMFL